MRTCKHTRARGPTFTPRAPYPRRPRHAHVRTLLGTQTHAPTYTLAHTHTPTHTQTHPFGNTWPVCVHLRRRHAHRHAFGRLALSLDGWNTRMWIRGLANMLKALKKGHGRVSTCVCSSRPEGAVISQGRHGRSLAPPLRSYTAPHPHIQAPGLHTFQH